VLVGRAEERERLDQLLASSRQERAASLVIRGEAGIGKTTLLGYAIDRAGDFQVLRIQGHESEAVVPFAALSWLLGPLTPTLPRLPAAQAAALRAALRLGPAAGGDRLAVAAATLTLFATAADERPLLVAVDDAHCLDVSSLEALVFAARRLHADPVAVLLTARPAEDLPAEMNALLEALPVLPLSGLDPESAGALLAARHAGLSPEALAERVAETAGNPLALIELPVLSQEALPVEPLRIGRRLEETFGRRLGEVPQATHRAMLLLATAGSRATDVLAAALDLRGLSPADLEPAEAAGLIEVDQGVVRFRHPLVRSALYQSTSPAERRAAHRTLAVAFGSLGTPWAAERQAWHLAAAATGPDEDAAAALDDAARAAAERRSYAAAVDLYEWSARLTRPGPDRARRLLQAADLSQQAGRPDAALPLLDRVLEETDDWRLRTAAQHLRCRIQMWRGHPVAARDLLVETADRVEAADPAWSAIMRAHAAVLSVTLGEQERAAAWARRAVELLAGLPETVTMPALVVHALTLAVGRQTEQARSVLTRCAGQLDDWDPLASEQLLLVAGLAWASLEEPEQAMRWLTRAVRSARDASAVGLLPFQLSWLAQEQWRGGNWTAAYSNADDAVALATETGWRTELPNSLATLATIEAGLGRAGDCRAHAAQAVSLAGQAGADVVAAHAAVALTLLELGTGAAGQAAQHADVVRRFAGTHGIGDPVLLSWAGDAVEAYVAAGQPDHARAAYDILLAEAEQSLRPTEMAVAARCRGLLAGRDDDAEEAFATALRRHAEARQPFQEARTRLHHGEALRRHRRRADAAAELAPALTVFDQLGAGPWSTRARSELQATGMAPRSRCMPAAAQLTPQELRVAVLVAEGATNAETAAQLFLSPKTVEYHLSSVYRKLQIRSRAQLVRVMGRAPDGHPPAPAD
jgi:DNA-binding CsgD family transcriptional regulator